MFTFSADDFIGFSPILRGMRLTFFSDEHLAIDRYYDPLSTGLGVV